MVNGSQRLPFVTPAALATFHALPYAVGKDTPLNAPPIVMRDQSSRVVLCAGGPLAGGALAGLDLFAPLFASRQKVEKDFMKKQEH
ncbi:MAG TPA: hypothetical protein VD794_06785 [Flavisolibacter sp.]|nr:hypothetical protein [Flavisolibacter sp.]